MHFSVFSEIGFVWLHVRIYIILYIYIHIYMYVCMYVCIYICQDGVAVGFVDFTKLLFALSSLAQPLKRVGSIPEYFFVILNQRKAWAGRFREETAGKRTGPITAPEASVHAVRNRLCYHFFLYQTNESCSRKLMLLISFNKSCLWVTVPNVTEAEGQFMNFLSGDFYT